MNSYSSGKDAIVYLMAYRPIDINRGFLVISLCTGILLTDLWPRWLQDWASVNPAQTGTINKEFKQILDLARYRLPARPSTFVVGILIYNLNMINCYALLLLFENFAKLPWIPSSCRPNLLTHDTHLCGLISSQGWKIISLLIFFF